LTFSNNLTSLKQKQFCFLRTETATALVRLSHCSSVCLSVRHTVGSVRNCAS